MRCYKPTETYFSKTRNWTLTMLKPKLNHGVALLNLPIPNKYSTGAMAALWYRDSTFLDCQ